MYAWSALILSYAGFTALALAMPRHHEELRGGKPGEAAKHLFRLTGIVFLSLSFLGTMRAWSNPAIAVSAWLGLLTVSAFALAMVLTYATGKNRRLLPFLPALAMLGAGLARLLCPELWT